EAQAHLDETARRLAVDRDQERQRLDQVRRQPAERLALAQRFADECEVEQLEIAQTAVDQFRGFRGGAGAEVALLEQRHRDAAQREVARRSRACDAAPDDDDVVVGIGQRCRARHGSINSPIDRPTASGATSAIRGSSARVMPDRTSTVARPPRLPMTMSVSIRSPTMTASAAGTPSLASAVSRMIGDGLPTITSTVAPVTASTPRILPAQSGTSPPALR